ncbi:hypothetical protein HHX47_DHR3001068 [Lentinula edodes]|nr:hypothetical protein HHX47_DHR3001068 [Lentinula edodes]
MSTEVDLIASYAGLLSLACICIYTGAFASLPTKKRAGRAENNTDSDDEDEDEQPEFLSVEDAWLFPILDSFKTGTALLSGLFIYDIWWVFGTPVMVEVATKLDVPIKLLWPKSINFSDESGFTLLGLGDVVIPGCFVALALRFDHHRYLKKGKAFSKPYFYASLLAYILGLVATMSVMHIFKAAQPALLYLRCV